MDTYRGNYIDQASSSDDWPEVDFGEEEAPREPPPSPIGQDERRMQVRAYNHWAGLLDNRNFPSVDVLEPAALTDFGPYSVLLDFSTGIENPAIRYLGDMLAAECGSDGVISTLSDVPARSLLSRITDHYMQILANQAPIGFEAEFVNQRGRTILYRGILLPFSSDDETIDFIYGVINWKELADQATTDELLLEIDQALEANNDAEACRDDPMIAWADGLADLIDEEGVLDLARLAEEPEVDLPSPEFGRFAVANQGDDEDDDGPAAALELDQFAEVEMAPAAEMAIDAQDMGLADWLTSARELAEAARGSEDRTRSALYAAIGRAYDFSLAAADAEDEFNELVVDSGLTVQDRAPMTPVVKLVFGADYDKTRLTEYASALSHAHRLTLGRGALAGYLATASGGLKGVVGEERRAKRAESGKPAELRDTPCEALAKKLRKLDHAPLDAVAGGGAEFTLLVARRLPTGEVVLLGEVADDVRLFEKAAKKLLR